MARRMACFLALALVAGVARTEAAAPPDQGLEALEPEMRARTSLPRDLDKFKAARAWYADRLLAFAERHPGSDDAFLALVRCVRVSHTHFPRGSPALKAMAILERDHVKHENMSKYVRLFARVADDSCSRLLRAVVERHPDRRTPARACHALARGRRELAQQGTMLKPGLLYLVQGQRLRMYFEHEHAVHGTHGQEYAKLLTANASKYYAEAETMQKVLDRDYPGMFPNLSIGRVAPEVISQGLDGKQVKLSELRGKVVVLDFWATWCGPCRAMIPHQRDMVKRLEGKSFVMVSISVDDDREKLARFVKKVPMPWTHWWDGPGNDLAFAWDVTAFPTIYVLDHKGVIRARGAHGKALDRAVDVLLKEMAEERERGQ